MIFDKENYEAFDQELWAAVHTEEVRQQKTLNSSPLKMWCQKLSWQHKVAF